MRENDYGETRGILLQVLALGGAFLASSVFFVIVLAAITPGELSPLHITQRELRRFADEGYFPLSAAAASLNMRALAYIANVQTFALFVILMFGAAYYVRRGFVSERLRSWSNIVWIVGLVVICVTSSLFPDLTLRQLDYAIISSWIGGDGTPFDAIYGRRGLNSSMLPAVFLIERGLFGALLIIGSGFVMHDIGYRVREVFEEFGFIDSQELEESTSGSREQSKGASGAKDTGRPDAVFGQRGTRPRPEPMGPEAQARIVLGVSATATRRDIERAYRSKMKRAHPDHGGTVERAAALNGARDTLLRRG